MNMEKNGGERRAETSRAATSRAAEYSETRGRVEKELSDRYMAVQRRLNGLNISKGKGMEAAAKRNVPALDDLAMLLRRATVKEIEELEVEKEELEQKMRDKNLDPAKYTVQ